MKSDSISGIRWLSFFIILFAAAIVIRLSFLQIVKSNYYSEAADRQYTTPSTRIFDRGSIFFKERNGELASAATLKSGFTVAINPKQIIDAEKTYESINKITPIDKKIFDDAALKKDDPYEEIAKRVDRESADKISALKIKGVNIYKDKWRFYPGQEVAARIIGFVGYDQNNQLTGRYGVERYYEENLSRNNNNLYTNFFAEAFSSLGDSIFNQEGREGDIILTIEPKVQKSLHEEILAIKEKWNSDLVGGIIINPMDGSIYAMEVVPSYDNNNFKSVKDPNLLNNPLVESVYEMGSIIKPLIMAAGLDAGVVTAKTTYNDLGFIELSGYKIKNFDGKARGVVPMQEVLNQSLNTGMVFVAKKLGKDGVRDYLLNYGIGEETGIDLPGEISGLVKNLESPREVEYATASFGQGIAMTPIEVVRALSTLGNGGKLIEPHIIDTIDYSGAFSRKPSYEGSEEQVISKKASEEITRMLVEVVDKALLGGTVKIPEYRIAAKTGTAQMAKENGKGYYEDRYLHSFFGYFPAYEPKFLVFLYTVNPKNGATFASHTLTYSFMNLTKFLLNYYEIPPDR